MSASFLNSTLLISGLWCAWWWTLLSYTQLDGRWLWVGVGKIRGMGTRPNQRIGQELRVQKCDGGQYSYGRKQQRLDKRLTILPLNSKLSKAGGY